MTDLFNRNQSHNTDQFFKPEKSTETNMKYDIYYTHNGKETTCTADCSSGPGEVAMRFHRTMQNDTKTEISYETVNGKKKRRSETYCVPRFSKEEYKIVAMSRAGIWYDEFSLIKTPDVSGEKPCAGFGDAREIDFPARVKEVAQ